MKRISILLLAILCLSTRVYVDEPEMRAVYCATFEIDSKAQCENIVNDILSSNINAVFVQVRGRADAYYYPNREDDSYPNNEPRGELYSISPSDFDALQFFIDRMHNASPPREVHAWCTTYNSWNRSNKPDSPLHVYNAHPEWITEDASGATYTYEDDAPLDPGIPAVQQHIYSVFMDIVRNYDVDGIHFDYIRLLGADSGYDPVALARFKSETGWEYDPDNPADDRLDEVYEAWRRDKVAQLVQMVHDQTMLEKPWVDVSAFTVSFTNPIENLAQGYNWWVAHDAIDVLHPSVYASSVSACVGEWNEAINNLKTSGVENKIPLVAAIGTYLLEDPGENAQAVTALRQDSRPPDGFNFFRHAHLFQASNASDLFDPGGLMDEWVGMPSSFMKEGEENIPPNQPASLNVSVSEGKPVITFQRPAAATDGDLPVHYRLYRDSQSPVRRYYDNMIMEWWDLASERTDFSFRDKEAPGDTLYYSAIAYDDWNNMSLTSSGPVQVSGGSEYIIETRSGGQHVSDYSEISGSFFNSSSHSDAPGCTDGIGSRFSLPSDGKNDIARFTPSGMSSDIYKVYVTCFNYSSADAPGITVRINDKNGVSTRIFNLTAANCGDKWTQCFTMDYEAGSGHYVEFDSSTQSNSGSNDRMNPAAVRFLKQGTPSEEKEKKPPVSPGISPVTEFIIDSEPVTLDYDDPGGSTAWVTTSWGTNYGGSARYYHQDNFPMDDYAVWVADIPREGDWAVDGYIRDTQGGLARGVQYRFVDGEGIVHNSTATLRTGTGGFTVNVDDLPSDQGVYFKKGRVYISIYGNATGAEMIIADALKFRLVDTPGGEGVSWMLY